MFAGAVWATDIATDTLYGTDYQSGVVRYDLTLGRFQGGFSGYDTIDVNAGLDGKLYALRSSKGVLDVYDFQAGVTFRHLELGTTRDMRAVAADAAGNIYIASWYGNILRFRADGTLERDVQTKVGNLIDIDLDEKGHLIASSHGGWVVTGDADLQNLSQFPTSGDWGSPAFVAFPVEGSFPEPAPEPSPTPAPTPPPNPETTPVASITGGQLTHNWPRTSADGYHFTPLAPGEITALGGHFQGTSRVRLFDRKTGAVLAEATVTSGNTWRFIDLPVPVRVESGRQYTVAAYLSGGSSTRPDMRFPKIIGSIRIDSGTSVSTASDPNVRPNNNVYSFLSGLADVRFRPFAHPVAGRAR